MKRFLKSSFPHIVAVLSFLLVALMYFYPQLEGKVVQQSDMIQYRGMVKEINDFREETGEISLWTNSMFGGMPAYQIHAPQRYNVSYSFYRALKLGIDGPIGLFIMGMLGFYITLVLLGVNPWLSMIGAIGFALGTNNLVLYEAGHTSKIMTIFSSAPIIAGTVLAYRGKFLVGGIVFFLFMAVNFFSNHPQMTYYLGISMIIFVLFQLYQDWKNGQLARFAKASGVLLIALVLAFGTSATRLLPTYEYAQSTMRGTPILQSENPNPTSSSETEGLEWNYAMSWSNGFLDLFSSYIPGMTGGSSREPLSSDAAFAKDLGRRGMDIRRGVEAPLYWGGLPSTSGPVYFGAVFVFLFMFSAFVIRGPLKWFLVISFVLMLLLSMGKNLEWLNRFVFDYFPLYNKFRTPNSILSVTAIFVPLLAILGIQKTIKNGLDVKKAERYLFISAGSLGLLSLFFALAGPSIFDFTNPGDPQYQQAGYNMDAIIEDRKSLLRSDSLRSLFLILLSGAALWMFIKGKLKKNILLLSLGVLVFFDVWFIGKRYISTDDFVNERVADQMFQPRPVDNQILQDPDPHYRVFDLTGQTFVSSYASYFHKSIGGNHAAKLQRYNDLIERHISRNNQRVLNMLNTKYFIVPNDQGVPTAQLNPAALGNAWFVNNINLVDNANAEIDALNSFDPAGVAIVHSEFSDYVSGLNPTKEGSIGLIEYKPNYLKYQSSTGTEQFAVFSEIWYGPNKGWKAYIDGEPVEHIRVNYALRGMKIPAGQHEIEFVFDPLSYRTGEIISLISSIILLLGIGFLAWKYLFPLFQNTGVEEKKIVQSTKKPSRKKTSAKTRKKK